MLNLSVSFASLIGLAGLVQPPLLLIKCKASTESYTLNISGTNLFSSGAQTDFKMEKMPLKSSVATKPQTYFHSLASDVFCHALSVIFCALKRDLFFPYDFILLLMFHAPAPFFHNVTPRLLKAHVCAGFVFISWCINRVDWQSPTVFDKWPLCLSEDEKCR